MSKEEVTDHPMGKCKFCKSDQLVAPIWDNMTGLGGWYHNRDYRLATAPHFCISCGKMNADNDFTLSGFKKEEPSCTNEQIIPTDDWTKTDYDLEKKYNDMECL